jgi:molybdate transport system substrate-binding protein
MRRGFVLLLAIAVILIPGCKKPRKAETQEDNREMEGKEILVLCGGSFRPPMEQLAKAFERKSGAKVLLSFGQSEDLLPQVRLGKTGDVFVSHDPYRDYVVEAEAHLRSEEVGFVAPVLVVRKGNPAGVKSIEDLAKPGLRVALPNPEFSTCGEMLFSLLEKKGIKKAVEKNAGNAVFRSHSETGNALKLGTRDAGVMWNGTAHNFLDAIDIVPTPYEYETVIRVWIIGLKYSKNPRLVGQFLDFCRSEGKRIFADFGYVREQPREKSSARLLLYCGAGIRLAVSEIVEAFEKKHGMTVEADYAGSNILLSRIKLSKQGDLYMPGDARYVAQAEREGLIASTRDACYFIPVILVRKGNPKDIQGVSDMARRGLRIGLGNERACAIGRVSSEILRKNGVDLKEVERNVVFRSLTVNELGVHIKMGRLDATLVWDAIAAQYPNEGEIVPIPNEKNVISTVPIAVLASSKQKNEAKVFQDFVVSEEAQAIFAKHHYTTEAPR